MRKDRRTISSRQTLPAAALKGARGGGTEPEPPAPSLRTIALAD